MIEIARNNNQSFAPMAKEQSNVRMIVSCGSKLVMIQIFSELSGMPYTKAVILVKARECVNKLVISNR